METDLSNFFSARNRCHHQLSVGGPRRLIESELDKHRLPKVSSLVEHVCSGFSRAPPNNPFLFRGILNPRSEDVDLYICEHFGQVLVSVGQNANRIAEYGLLKMLRSRCFATIVQRPVSRSSPVLHEPRPDLEPPSLERVRAADSDFRS